MRTARLALALGISFGLSTAAIAVPAWAAPPAAKSASDQAVEPEALQALARMSAYLGTLTTFEVKAETSLDVVMESGEKIQLDGVTHYKIRRPDGFVIELTIDRQVRRMIYDGKQFTLDAPQLGYYATVPAPPTGRQTLDAIYDRYGLALPLEDLFRWSDPNNARPAALTSGYRVGTATIDGAETEQYAFREGVIDWQVWIQKGDQPIPRKLVIIDRSDPEHPAYSARLTWNVSPTLTAEDFAFRPAEGAKAIQLTETKK